MSLEKPAWRPCLLTLRDVVAEVGRAAARACARSGLSLGARSGAQSGPPVRSTCGVGTARAQAPCKPVTTALGSAFSLGGKIYSTVICTSLACVT